MLCKVLQIWILKVQCIHQVINTFLNVFKYRKHYSKNKFKFSNKYKLLKVQGLYLAANTFLNVFLHEIHYWEKIFTCSKF